MEVSKNKCVNLFKAAAIATLFGFLNTTAAQAKVLDFIYQGGNLGGQFSFDTDTEVFSDVSLTYIGSLANDPNFGVTQPFTWNSLQLGAGGGFAFSGNISGIVGGGLRLDLPSVDFTKLYGIGFLTGNFVYFYKNPGCNCGGTAGGQYTFGYQDAAAIPLPASLPLLASGLAIFGCLRRRRSRQS